MRSGVRKREKWEEEFHSLWDTFFFFFFEKQKRDSRVAVIIPCPTGQLNKPMGITSSNWSSETSNPHTPQALLVSRTSRNCNYSPCENSNLGWDETSQSPTSCTTPTGGLWDSFYLLASCNYLNINLFRGFKIDSRSVN